jgi:hypothetical protein
MPIFQGLIDMTWTSLVVVFSVKQGSPFCQSQAFVDALLRIGMRKSTISYATLG